MSSPERASATRNSRQNPDKETSFSSLTRFLYGYVSLIFLYIISRGFFVPVRPVGLVETLVKLLSCVVVFVLLVLFFKTMHSEYGWRNKIPVRAFLMASLTAAVLEIFIFI